MVAVLAAVLPAAGWGAFTAGTLRFTTLQQAGFGPVLTSRFGNANVVIVLSVSGAGTAGPFNYASEAWARRLDWNASFALSAAVAEPTTGYRLTIRRITIQRIHGAHRQFCVIAYVTRPDVGAAVLRRSWALHVVKLSRRPFRTRFRYQWTIPGSAVLKTVDGKLLAVGYTSELGKAVYPPAPGLCRP
jgi:hypothetical protein